MVRVRRSRPQPRPRRNSRSQRSRHSQRPQLSRRCLGGPLRSLPLSDEECASHLGETARALADPARNSNTVTDAGADPPAGAAGRLPISAGDGNSTPHIDDLPGPGPDQNADQSAKRPANFSRASAVARMTRCSSSPRTTILTPKRLPLWYGYDPICKSG